MEGDCISRIASLLGIPRFIKCEADLRTRPRGAAFLFILKDSPNSALLGSESPVPIVVR